MGGVPYLFPNRFEPGPIANWVTNWSRPFLRGKEKTMSQYDESPTMRGSGQAGEIGGTSLEQTYPQNTGDTLGQIKTAVSNTVRNAANSLHRTADQVSVRE